MFYDNVVKSHEAECLFSRFFIQWISASSRPMSDSMSPLNSSCYIFPHHNLSPYLLSNLRHNFNNKDEAHLFSSRIPTMPNLNNKRSHSDKRQNWTHSIYLPTFSLYDSSTVRICTRRQCLFRNRPYRIQKLFWINKLHNNIQKFIRNYKMECIVIDGTFSIVCNFIIVIVYCLLVHREKQITACR